MGNGLEECGSVAVWRSNVLAAVSALDGVAAVVVEVIIGENEDDVVGSESFMPPELVVCCSTAAAGESTAIGTRSWPRLWPRWG